MNKQQLEREILKSLLDDEYIRVPIDLAATIGLNEAIVLRKFHEWVKSNEKREQKQYLHQGVFWTVFDYRRLHKEFPFWSERTIQRICLQLEQGGLLTSIKKNQNKGDCTKWYRPNFDALIEKYLQYKGSQNKLAPPPDDKLAPSTYIYSITNEREIAKSHLSQNSLRSEEAMPKFSFSVNKTESLNKTENLKLGSDIPAPPSEVITATVWMLKKFEEMKLEDVDIVPKVLLTEKRMRNYKMPWEVVAFDSKYLSYDSGFIDNWAHDWADSKKCPDKWAEYIPQVTATVSNHSQTVGGLKKLIARYAGYQEKLAFSQKVEEEARQIRESVESEPMAPLTGQRGAAPLPAYNFHWRSHMKKWAPDEKEVYDICTDEQKNAQAAVWLQGNGYKVENIEEYI